MAERRRRRPSTLNLAILALFVALAAAIVLGPGDTTAGLSLAAPDTAAADAVRATIDRLPDAPLVLVGMDADLGTYAEIRTPVRAALADLQRRSARLVFVSFSVEGRAIGAAEVERLRERGTGGDGVQDLGFVSGAEAGLVRSVTELPAGTPGTLDNELQLRGGGIGAFDMALVVGGVDFGPRSWIEQVGTRVPELPIVAIAPTAAQPELAPYLRTGQLTGLLATVRDGAAYAELVAADGLLETGEHANPVHSSMAMLAGMLIALLMIGRAILAGSRPTRGEEREERDA